MKNSRLYYAAPLELLEETLLLGIRDPQGIILMTDESMAGIYSYQKHGLAQNVCVFAIDRRAFSMTDRALSELIAGSFFVRVWERYIPPTYLEIIDCIEITPEDVRKYPDQIW